MKKTILSYISITVLSCLAGCQFNQGPPLKTVWNQFHEYQNQDDQNVWYNSPAYKKLLYSRLKEIVKIAPDRFVFKDSDLKIPIYFSNPLTEYNPETKYLLILIHGGGLNANHSFQTGQQVIESLGLTANHFLLLAPQFLEGVERNERGLLSWGFDWRGGGFSISSHKTKDLNQLSSFTVIDRLINAAIDHHPGITRVILMGHSAGGQFVNRYAATNNCADGMVKKDISFVYITANPSSYLYLDSNRYEFNSRGETQRRSRKEIEDCPKNNRYIYGLDNRFGYAETLSKQDIKTRFLNRSIIFLLGEQDNKRNWSLDISCQAEIQGNNRIERGLLYQYHLSRFYENNYNPLHIWLRIPDVGHDSRQMLTHPIFIKELKKKL